MKESTIKTPLSMREYRRQTQGDFTKTPLALGMTAVMMSAPAFVAQAADVDQNNDTVQLETMDVEDRAIETNPYAEKGAPYKAKTSGDPRHVKDLAETPQTISVLTQTQIEESGRSDLRDILSAQPGITLGTGENGNAFGDRYIIRGHEARSDVFVDGLRDPGMTTRESFAVEQVEITKGPSSTFAGRGSTGGAVNSITKQAGTAYDFGKVDLGLGTDEYRRFSLDTNKRISDEFAVRLNLLHNYEEVPDRGPADRERNGFALSGLYQPNERFKLLADVYYLDAKDKPDLGTFIESGGSPVNNVPVYMQDQDFIESEILTFTVRASYAFTRNLRIENLMRYGTTDNGYVVTGYRGTGLSTHQGWQEVDYFANQTNLFLDTTIAGMKNQFVVTAEYSDYQVLNGVYDVNNTGATNCMVSGRGGTNPGYCITDNNGNYMSNIGNIMGRSITKSDWDSDYNVETFSVSLMDTIDITDRWSVFAGVRADRFDYSNTIASGGVETPYEYSDTLWNGHAGIVFDVMQNANVYFTYSTSANINGGESDVGGSCGYGGICGAGVQDIGNSEPELTENLELGTKWNLMGEKLLFTAAIFQITKDDVMENLGGDDYDAIGTLNTGKNRVRGFEVALVGNITDKLSTQFGITSMDAEILDSNDSSNIGKTLSNFAERSAFLQLRYQLTPKFSFGGTYTAQSELFSGQPDSPAGENYKVPGYGVVDLFANYSFTDNLKARLNVGNILDKDYYTASYRSGAFTYIGDARNAQLTLNYTF